MIIYKETNHLFGSVGNRQHQHLKGFVCKVLEVCLGELSDAGRRQEPMLVLRRDQLDVLQVNMKFRLDFHLALRENSHSNLFWDHDDNTYMIHKK